jgi:hypothetical protein
VARSLARIRRIRANAPKPRAPHQGARLGRFKPLADYDWKWPKKIDKTAIDDLFKLSFFEDGANSVLLGPNGVGKTMLLKNLAHHSVMRGHTVRFTTASAMLNELALQDSSAGLHRRIKHYTDPQLLCIDEVGYLSYDSRYADLLFEVVTRPLRGAQARRAHHEQALLRVARRLPARCLRRHPRRPPDPPLRSPAHRGPELPRQGSQRTRRCQKGAQAQRDAPRFTLF